MKRISKKQLQGCEINYYNYDEIFEKFYNIRNEKLIKQFKKENILTKGSKDWLKVLHRCTKREGYQISYFIFKNNEYISTGDIFRLSIHDIILEF